MTNNLNPWINKQVRITTTVGNQAWHYTGKIISISDTHINLQEKKEGIISIPIIGTMIREVIE